MIGPGLFCLVRLADSLSNPSAPLLRLIKETQAGRCGDAGPQRPLLA